MLEFFKERMLHLIGDVHFDETSSNPKVLLAVSGGIDSMCMAHLFYISGYKNFAVAHVNFKLREEDSDGDEELIQSWCKQRGIEFFSNHFETHSYSEEHSISTQMAARELRYVWFNSLICTYGFNFLSVAHNLNDSVETLFLNILRGTGIRGLSGIKEKNDKIIRPLISVTRAQIVAYVSTENIPYRNDRTNLESHYSRNRIRNMVFPQFEKVNSSFLRTIERNIKYFTQSNEIVEDLFRERSANFIEESGTLDKSLYVLKINIKAIKAEKYSICWLHMALDEYGFNAAQIDEIHSAFDSNPGKSFSSKDFILVRDRDYMILYKKEIHEDRNLELNISLENFTESVCEGSNSKTIEYKFKYLDNYYILKIYNKSFNFKPLSSNSILFVDADVVSFPLKIRRWHTGDKFIPLGMNRFKKLSDFYTDGKLDKVMKSKQCVIISEGNIVCLLGHRIDNRYKINDGCSRVLEISTE